MWRRMLWLLKCGKCDDVLARWEGYSCMCVLQGSAFDGKLKEEEKSKLQGKQVSDYVT